MNDFGLDINGDLSIANGDFVIVDATRQHQQHIIIANKGEYKQNPEVGVGIVETLNSEKPKQVLITIKRNLEYDGMLVNGLNFTNDKLNVDAEY